jgi:serine/threonine protein kinase
MNNKDLLKRLGVEYERNATSKNVSRKFENFVAKPGVTVKRSICGDWVMKTPFQKKEVMIHALAHASALKPYTISGSIVKMPDGEQRYIQDCVRGVSLARLLDDPLAWGDVAKLRRVHASLHALRNVLYHGKIPVEHMDLKNSNNMIVRDDCHVVVIDWNISRVKKDVNAPSYIDGYQISKYISEFDTILFSRKRARNNQNNNATHARVVQKLDELRRLARGAYKDLESSFTMETGRNYQYINHNNKDWTMDVKKGPHHIVLRVEEDGWLVSLFVTSYNGTTFALRAQHDAAANKFKVLSHEGMPYLKPIDASLALPSSKSDMPAYVERMYAHAEAVLGFPLV